MTSKEFAKLLLIFFILFCVCLCKNASAEGRTRIAIIDSGLDMEYYKDILCKDTSFEDFTGKGKFDDYRHGNIITALVTKNLDKTRYCVTMLKYTNPGIDGNTEANLYLKGLTKAIELMPTYLVLALSGREPLYLEEVLLKKLINNGTIVFSAAGNNKLNLDAECQSYPACLNLDRKKFRVIGSLDNFNNRANTSNYGSIVPYWDLGVSQGNDRFGLTTGTSPATANYANKYIRGLVK